MENDTSSDWLRCMCYFDLAVTIKTPPAGQYSLIIHTTNKFIGDTTFVADTTLSINQVQLISFSAPDCVNIPGGLFDQDDVEIPLTDHYESGCQSPLNPVLYASSYDKNVHLVWYIDSINCDIKPDWQGFLENDTFHVTVTDTGIQNSCSCPQYLTATFGPFQPGTYILDFINSQQGQIEFTIGGTRKGQTLATVSSYQSNCYYPISNEPETTIPAKYTLLRSYPNPFNPVTTIEFCLPQ